MQFQLFKSALVRTGLAAAGLLLGGTGVHAQQVNLTAGPTTATLADGSAVPMWGYSCGAAVTNSTATCAALNPNAAGGWAPVVITVPYVATGTTLTINLTTSLSFVAGTGSNNIPASVAIVGQLGGGLGTTANTGASPTHAQLGVSGS